MRSLVAGLALSLTFLGILAVRGELPPARPEAAAESAATRLLTAAATLDWNAYAELMDEDSLREFRKSMTPLLVAVESKPSEEQAAVLTLFDARDVKTALAWEPREFFARFMKGTAAQGPLKDNFNETKTKVVGTVLERPDQAHVVVRSTRTVRDAKLEKMDVLTLRLTKAGWKAALPAELRSLGETLKLSFGNTNTETTTTTDAAEPEKN